MEAWTRRLAAKPAWAVHMTKSQFQAYGRGVELGDVATMDGDLLAGATLEDPGRFAWRTSRGRAEAVAVLPRAGAAARYRPSLSAPIAQLDRASDYESEGRLFESAWAHSVDRLSLRALAGRVPSCASAGGAHVTASR